MSTTPNPLAPYMVSTQKIVMAAMAPCADTRAAIIRLARLVCTVEANDALLKAGAFDDLQLGRAPAAA